jgi:hypothetical protein
VRYRLTQRELDAISHHARIGKTQGNRTRHNSATEPGFKPTRGGWFRER